MDKSDDVEKDVKMWQGVTKIDRVYIWAGVKESEDWRGK